MDSLMKYINRIYRCAGQYRSVRLGNNELRPHQHFYLFHVCKNPGISQEQLAQRIWVNKSNVTRQINALEKQGYVTRIPDENDRRVMRVYPTPNAQKLYPDVQRSMKEWNEMLFSELSETEQEQFVNMLSRIADRAKQAVEGKDGTIPDWDSLDGEKR